MTDDTFEHMRPRLMGIAYRMLGTLSEAEDAVQDVYIKWSENSAILRAGNSSAWLVKVCTNRCLDILKSAHRKRMRYVGPWLPEPLHTTTDGSPEDMALNASSLSFAFLALLERLTPKERAAFLLREVFDYDYADVSEVLGISAVSCRQLVSRAKVHIDHDVVRSHASEEKKTELLGAFRLAVETGNTRQFEKMLSRSIQLHADGGGQVVAAQSVVCGAADITALIRMGLHRVWAGKTMQMVEVNGDPGLVLWDGSNVFGCVSLDISDSGQIQQIFVVRNPDKLIQLHREIAVEANTGAVFDSPTVTKKGARSFEQQS